LFTYQRTFFLCQYALDVATISSATFLESTTELRNDRGTHVFLNSSLQLKKHSSHLKFTGWFSKEQNLLQEIPWKEDTRIQIRGERWPKLSLFWRSG